MDKIRHDHEPPPAVSDLGWQFHHLGIPTTVPHPDETHLEQLKLYVRGFKNSPFGIEWMRFEPDCQVHELIRRVPHLAFVVDDLEAALQHRTLLSDISSPSDGVRVAMIIDDGAPIELMEFSNTKDKESKDEA